MLKFLLLLLKRGKSVVVESRAIVDVVTGSIPVFCSLRICCYCWNAQWFMVAPSFLWSRVRFPFLVVFVFVSTAPLEVGSDFSFRAGCPGGYVVVSCGFVPQGKLGRR